MIPTSWERCICRWMSDSLKQKLLTKMINCNLNTPQTLRPYHMMQVQSKLNTMKLIYSQLKKPQSTRWKANNRWGPYPRVTRLMFKKWLSQKPSHKWQRFLDATRHISMRKENWKQRLRLLRNRFASSRPNCRKQRTSKITSSWVDSTSRRPWRSSRWQNNLPKWRCNTRTEERYYQLKLMNFILSVSLKRQC